MLMKVKTSSNTDVTYEVDIPLWRVKMLTPVDDYEDLFKIKIDDTWNNYYINRDTAEKVSQYIHSKEYADMRN